MDDAELLLDACLMLLSVAVSPWDGRTRRLLLCCAGWLAARIINRKAYQPRPSSVSSIQLLAPLRLNGNGRLFLTSTYTIKKPKF